MWVKSGITVWYIVRLYNSFCFVGTIWNMVLLYINRRNKNNGSWHMTINICNCSVEEMGMGLGLGGAGLCYKHYFLDCKRCFSFIYFSTKSYFPWIIHAINCYFLYSTLFICMSELMPIKNYPKYEVVFCIFVLKHFLFILLRAS